MKSNNVSFIMAAGRLRMAGIKSSLPIHLHLFVHFQFIQKFSVDLMVLAHCLKAACYLRFSNEAVI